MEVSQICKGVTGRREEGANADDGFARWKGSEQPQRQLFVVYDDGRMVSEICVFKLVSMSNQALSASPFLGSAAIDNGGRKQRRREERELGQGLGRSTGRGR